MCCEHCCDRILNSFISRVFAFNFTIFYFLFIFFFIVIFLHNFPTPQERNWLLQKLVHYSILLPINNNYYRWKVVNFVTVISKANRFQFNLKVFLIQFLFFCRFQILSVFGVCSTLVLAEPPVHRPSSSYLPPSNSYLPPSHHSGGSSFGGGSSLLSGSGSGYHAVGSGFSESEGFNIDQQLLHKIEEILLDQENQAASHHHGHHGGHGGHSGHGGSLSNSYLPPSTR